MELIAQRVSHAYGGLAVLDGIDLAVREGEILAIIGPSGCGKSTLLGILGGLLQPTAGHVFVAGERPPGCLNAITYVFQDFALLPWRTAAGNVALALEHHPLTRAEREQRVQEALALTGLSEFAQAYPRQLSGGMRQRVGVARALAVRPAVMLLDEPLSALDAQTRELLIEDFIRLWLAQRTTAVCVTHNLHEALRLADRIAVLARRPGRVREIVEVPYPHAERATPAVQLEVARLHAEVWGHIRAEAQMAEREIAHA